MSGVRVLLLRRPKSLKCWGLGAELDLEFNVTKNGDVEAETAAREAKAAARAARGREEEDGGEEEADRAQEERGQEETPAAAAKTTTPGTKHQRGGRRRRSRGLAVVAVADEVAALRGTRPATFKDLLTHPAFSRLLAAMTISSLGDWVGFVAVTTLVTRLSGSVATAGFAIGAVMIARMLPAVLFSPIAGALVDRVDRKRIMMLSDVGRGTMYAAMAFVGELWAIFLLSFAIECLAAVEPRPRRHPAEHGAAPPAQERERDRTGEHVRDPSARGGGLLLLAAFSSWVGAACPARCSLKSLALLLDAGTFAFSAFMVSRIAFPLGVSLVTGGSTWDGSGVMWSTGCASCARTRSPRDDGGHRRRVRGGGSGAGRRSDLRQARSTPMPRHGASSSPRSASEWGSAWRPRTRSPRSSTEGSRSSGPSSRRGALFVLASMPNCLSPRWSASGSARSAGLAWVSGYTLLQENVEDEYRGRTSRRSRRCPAWGCS